jgi:hypothetical protein
MQCGTNATLDIDVAQAMAEGLNCAADFATVHAVAERIAGAHDTFKCAHQAVLTSSSSY